MRTSSFGLWLPSKGRGASRSPPRATTASLSWPMARRAFFRRAVMGRLGADPELFRPTQGAVAAPILDRARRAFTVLAPHDNPYLRYILTGTFASALPDYLLPATHDAIRDRLDRIELRRAPVEAVLAALPSRSVDAFNFSDIAEYMDLGAYHRLLAATARAAAPGARLAYWNLLASRRRPSAMAESLEAREPEATRLGDEARAS